MVDMRDVMDIYSGVRTTTSLMEHNCALKSSRKALLEITRLVSVDKKQTDD